MRLHLCWGNYEGPHNHDIPLREIIEPVLQARPPAVSFEGANPRHEHEWAVFQEVKLPDGKCVVPGVVDSTTNFIEHPELVAQRIERYADVVGRENVVAGVDCGFATFAGAPTVVPRSPGKARRPRRGRTHRQQEAVDTPHMKGKRQRSDGTTPAYILPLTCWSKTVLIGLAPDCAHAPHVGQPRPSEHVGSTPREAQRCSPRTPLLTHLSKSVLAQRSMPHQHVQLVTALPRWALRQTKELGKLDDNRCILQRTRRKEQPMKASNSVLTQGTASGEDIERYEVVDGVRVEREPMRAFETVLASWLCHVMNCFAAGKNLGLAVNEVLFVLNAARNLQRRPDVVFVSHAR